MSERKHLGRGLETVSHLFLSRRQPSKDEAPAPTPSGATTPFLFVASGFEVIGKSVVACNVAIELARRGHRTAVVDADPSLPTLRLLMGALLEPTSGPPRLVIDEQHGLTLFDTMAQATEAAETWDCVVVNAPSTLFSGEAPPVSAQRLLLVVSPEPRELIRAYAVAKSGVGWSAGLQVGLVVRGVEDDASARAFFDQFRGVLGRRLALRPAYCGFLPERDEIGRSVLSRVPAVLGAEDADLVERLRGIAGAVARVFEPGRSARSQ